jgi:hypothetical protein
MIWIVVEANLIGFVTSEQCTTIPFKPMLTESMIMDNLVTRGKAPSAEIFVKVIVVEFKGVSLDRYSSLELINSSLMTSTRVPCSLTLKIFHLRNSTVAVQVS